VAATTSPLARTRQAQAGSTRALRIVVSVLIHVTVISGAILFTLPFLWMVRTSLLRPELIAVEPPVWIPWPPEWRNYSALFELGPFGAWMTNSVIVTLLATLGNTLTSAIVAFGFARTTFVGRDRLFVLVLATMMIPFQVTLVPQYVLFWQLGWLNTLLPLVVPELFGRAFFIFILRQFFMSLPRELDEAAKIDGASLWQVLWLIVLPLAKPAIATVAVFAFIDHWNEFIRPLVYVQTPENLTLAVGVRWFAGRYEVMFHYLMASAVLLLAPIIVAFFVAQKQFIRGIALTGLKA
jgi:ABC-type glycerol-3-phosphate transport system permease component